MSNHFLPAVLLSVDDFLSLGSPKPARRAAAQVDYVDEMGQLAESSIKYIFFSHQWTANDEPDHTGAQYKVMVAALHKLLEEYSWERSRVRVWVDYASTPQANRDTKDLAINSFVSYAACSSAFVSVAPPVMHRERRTVCDAPDAFKRGGAAPNS